MGHDPDSLPEVGRADVFSTHNDRFAGVTLCLQLVENPVQPERTETNESRNVFCQEPLGPDVSDDAEVFAPEPSVVFVPEPLSGDAGGLAGRTTGDHVDSSAKRESVESSDVAMLFNLRPVLREDASAVRVLLAKGDRLHPGRLKPDADSADAGEEVEHHHEAPRDRASNAMISKVLCSK
ncbi:MAG: hypothetical protein Q8P41_31770 [Pseudomonadota bacterium]|nr:hypothetical protein [Pseudomonadota bacterium]